MQSVIISTYNKPRHLRLALEGLRQQPTRDFEIVVADDGSGPETARVVEEFANSSDVPIQHVWQEDRGFRAARVRNLGAKASRGDQLVFLDGDCVPFRDFLAAHAEAARDPRRVTVGDRLFLGPQASDTLSPDDVPRLPSIVPRREIWGLRKRALKNTFYQVSGLKGDRPKMVTANLALSREAFEAINGLDERFVGWGHEDEDLRRRLVRRGYPIHSLLTRARVCHIWHEPVESFHGRVKYCDNAAYYHRGFFLSRCRQGLDHRPLESCRIVWNGDPPPANGEPIEISVAWGARPRWSVAEIRVLVTSSPVGREKRGREKRNDPWAPHLRIVLGHGSRTLAMSGDDPGRNSAVPPTVYVAEAINVEALEGRRRILELLDAIV